MWLGALVVGMAGAGAAATVWYSRHNGQGTDPASVRAGDGVNGPAGMVHIPGGEFLMGSDHKMSQANERPAHKVQVKAFWMDQHHVTNAEFRKFV